MKNAITTLRIQNFKSIKDVEMKPRRVNIIIGEPNVGKSNILEAISLLGGMVYDRDEYFMKGMIRYQQANQLFYDNLISNTISVTTDRDGCYLSAQEKEGLIAVFMNNNAKGYLIDYISDKTNFHELWPAGRYFLERLEDFTILTDKQISKLEKGLEFGWLRFDIQGKVVSRDATGFESSSHYVIPYVKIRPYFFIKGGNVGAQFTVPYLFPPHGENLKSVIQTYTLLRKEITLLLKRTGHKLSLRMGDDKLEIVKDIDGIIYSYPYSSIADTLQRLIFYLAAIESNDDAVILLEEPEAHSFPVYVSQLGQRIVTSRNNQFFVATHSPYLITEILEEMLTDEELRPELAMFVAYYEDYQTKVRQLSDEEVLNIRRDGLDVFYNMARFVPQR